MKRFLGFLLLSSALSAQAALTIGAYNIRNFDYDERARIKTNEPELANIIKSMRADIMSVEEVVNKAEFESFITKQMPGYAVKVSDCGGTHNQHLGFIYNTSVVQLLSFNEDLSITEPGTSGSCNGGARPLAIGLFQVKATGQKFYGMTAHLKSGSDPQSMGIRMKQFPILQKIISELRTKSGIKDFYVAGDMNTTEYLNRGSDYKALTQVVSALGMVDLMANTACSAYWWGGSDDGIETPSLLDHLIVTPGLMKVRAAGKVGGHCAKVACRQVPVKDLGISYQSVSDHCPIAATVQ